MRNKTDNEILRAGGLFVLKYAESQVLVLRPSTDQDAVHRARYHFQELSDLPYNQIRFKTDKFQDGTSVACTEISQAACAAVVKHLTGVEVYVKKRRCALPSLCR
jgi:hypothetical protein